MRHASRLFNYGTIMLLNYGIFGVFAFAVRSPDGKRARLWVGVSIRGSLSDLGKVWRALVPPELDSGATRVYPGATRMSGLVDCA